MCKISIISPVYNTEIYLKNCIESVLKQDFTDFELILINDGSPDNSSIILEDYDQKDSRIKVINKQNEGQGVARNVALQVAKGKYILYLDSDDWLEEGSLTKIYNKFQEDNYDIIFFNACFYHQETGKKNEYRYIDCYYPRFKERVFSAETASDILFSTNGLLFKAFNKDFLINNDIKFTNTKYIEDSEFFIKAVLYANKMVCLNEVIINYRVHSMSSRSTTHKNIKVIESTYYICEKIFENYYRLNHDEDLLRSFLINRLTQLSYHFHRCKKTHQKQYYYMQQRLAKHIDKKYKLNSIKDSFLINQYLNIKNKSYLTNKVQHFLLSLSLFLPCYLKV